MDKKKLKEAAIDYSTYIDSDDYDVTIYDAFTDGAEWLMGQPIADRLTDEERVKIKAKYNELKSLNSITNDMFSDDTAIFEWLFGKEMFEPKTK